MDIFEHYHWKNDVTEIMKYRAKKQGKTLRYGKDGKPEYIHSSSYMNMSKADRELSEKWKEKMIRIFDFIDRDKLEPIEIIFWKDWKPCIRQQAVFINKSYARQGAGIIFWEFNGTVDYEFCSILYHFLRCLIIENGCLSISRNSIKPAVCLLYNKALNLALTEFNDAFDKRCIEYDCFFSDKGIKSLCSKLNIECGSYILKDLDVSYKDEFITQEYRNKVIQQDWKQFLKSLLPEHPIPDFSVELMTQPTQKLHGKYYRDKKRIHLYLFSFHNWWNKTVDTAIHEF